MPVKPPLDTNARGSASAVDADSPLRSQDAAEAEEARINQWTKPGPGRHESQKDGSFGFRERK
jgi:hypothetical protein